jgi:ferredoxin--NADP+ reductase/benzoate/toluate 1,2-dioxygenase reductase subunit
MMNVQVDKAIYLTESVRTLTPSTYVLRFSRNGMQFNPGQHLVLGIPGSSELREYSIYSGIHDPFLEVLIKEVDEGLVSKQLKSIRPGDPLEVKGPYGFFLGNAPGSGSQPILFISSGTGIAPFHSYVKSFPGADYRVIHGVRMLEEAYDATNYEPGRFLLCTSQDPRGTFEGRLTDYLLEAELHPDWQVYLCGNSHMIYDAMDILHARGIPQRHIFTEVYF